MINHIEFRNPIIDFFFRFELRPMTGYDSDRRLGIPFFEILPNFSFHQLTLQEEKEAQAEAWASFSIFLTLSDRLMDWPLSSINTSGYRFLHFWRSNVAVVRVGYFT